MNNNYPYKWSINVSVNPVHFLFLRVWIGNNSWSWVLRKPLKVIRQ